MPILRRSFVLVVAALILWRVVALGLSSHYVERIQAGETEASTKALAWNSRHPQALLAQGMALREKDPDRARALLVRAYGENPADARPLIVLAATTQGQGDQARATALVTAAVQLMPSDPWIQRQAANHWALQGDLEKAMGHWSRALEADPMAREQLFPILLALAEDPRTGLAFKPIAVEPPPWWEAFFAEVAKQTLDVEPVRLLYALRRESSQMPVSEAERKTYVARLIREGRMAEAYIEWVNGLTRPERAQLGLLHDGGFELEATHWGFDWHVRSTPIALVDRAGIYGVDGKKALHLLFSGQEGRFADVYQPLFLDPGTYRLTGRVRTESLDTQGGLKWTLRCLKPEASDLGESERFLGSNEWRDFGFEFKVPKTCLLQEIRLNSAGRHALEHIMRGGAWFDRLAIRKMATPVRAADPAGTDAAKAASKPPRTPQRTKAAPRGAAQ